MAASSVDVPEATIAASAASNARRGCARSTRIYSGIFIDYLLLDRPIIFTPVDLESYAKTRSFLYGPFDEWTPGRKVLTQNELVGEISALLEGGDEFELERRSATNIWHDYQDNKSSERSSEVIKKLLFSGEKN